MLVRRNFLRLSALGLASMPLARTEAAFAADYPTKAVRWVVGYVPAGSTDILARLMGAYLTEKLHQQFIIENKPGAGNNIGTEYVINSPPDGYTVYLVNPANGINASLYKKLELQLHPRYGAGRRPRRGAERDDHEPEHAGEDRCRVHRLREKEPRQDEHGVVRQRHVRAYVRRTFHGHDRRCRTCPTGALRPRCPI